MPDRRESAWQDPRTWVSVLGILLTIALAILGFIASQLASINQSVQSTRDAVLIVTTRQEADNKSLTERVQKLENAMVAQEKGFNFNFTTRLAGVEAQLKVKPPKEQE